MRTFRIENLTSGEISAILASLVAMYGEVNETKNDKMIEEHTTAIYKVLHPVVVDDVISPS